MKMTVTPNQQRTRNTTSEGVKNNAANSSNNNNRNNEQQQYDDSPEMLVQMVLEVITRIWIQIKHATSIVMIDMDRIIEKIAQWSVRNPQISLCLFVGIMIMSLPALIIMGFGISTLLMTFTGFLIFEGALLTIVSMLLFGCLAVLVLALIFLGLILVALHTFTNCSVAPLIRTLTFLESRDR